MSAKHEELDDSIEAVGDGTKYEVGYGRPPVKSRFKKGQSGNPTGRRKYTDSQRGQQLLRQEANRLVTIREGERVVRVTALQAALRSLFYTAAKGNTSAQKMVLDITQKAAEPETQYTFMTHEDFLFLDDKATGDSSENRPLTEEELQKLEDAFFRAGEHRNPRRK